ncbi:MAG TPA: TIGR03013 family XrtA/PEP-CTERM system glycosyltransferase [Vicinamibacterales bacterium]|jgi:sugar transferase (PEP-CTERM system associated)
MKALSASISRRAIALVMCETLLIVLAVSLGAAIRIQSDAWDLLFQQGGIGKALLIAFVCQVCLYYADLYELRAGKDRRELFIGIVQALSATSFVLAAIYFWWPRLVIGRGVFAVSSALVLLTVSGWRFAFEWLTRQVAPRERLLVVGTGTAAVNLARELFARRQELGVEIVGFVDPDPARLGQPLINPGVIGTIEDIPSIVRARQVDRVVVNLADARGKLPMDKLLEMKLDGVTFDHLASVYEELTGKIAVENLRPSWLIFSSGFRKSRLLESAKRFLDIAVSLTGLLLAAPLLALAALAVRLSSPGPVLYRQERVGRHGRVFTVVKFRSMRQDAEAGTGAVWARQNDDRVTPIGRFMRRTRIDEIPQIWNVLRGDMSFVGPRPERPEFVEQLRQQIPFYVQRHVVRPGLTGWAQVRYSYGASVEDALEKLQYDLFYIKHLSIALDLFIIFSTIKTVILRRGA